MSGFWTRILGAAFVVAALAVPGTLYATDGRREINQAIVVAAGGFPYVISAPGSYVLTGDLTPTPNGIGIQINADDVAIDLNGFSIQGNLTCAPGACTGSGPSKGIGVPAAPTTNGRRCTVRNGTIRGINGTAIELRDGALVDAVSVSDTFFHGIILGPNSMATRNRVTAVGRSGLFLGAGSGYAQNVIARTGQFFAFGSVSGGKSLGGNVCDDGRCAGARRFYLTTTPVPGNQPLTACDAGFHMASRWELQQVSTLRYDASRGFVHPGGPNDQLPGPPSNAAGWIRVGMPAATGLSGAGLANCNAWQSASVSDNGSFANLIASNVPSPEGSFLIGSAHCSNTFQVWCMEDD